MAIRDGTILIVEDDAAVREILSEVLSDEGFDTVVASDGREAVSILEAADALPCLILLDLTMPRMTGAEFRAWQVREARFARIPVVVLSAVRDLSAQAAHLGTVQALPKPVDLDVLIDCADRHCRPSAC